MEEGIDAEVRSNSELNDGDPVKTACDPLILPRYCVYPQGEDDMSEKRNQREVGDFKEHRLLTTEGRLAWGNEPCVTGLQLRRITWQPRRCRNYHEHLMGKS